MKRALVITIILALLSAVGIAYASIDLNGRMDDVEILQEDISGNPKLLDGIHLDKNASISRRLFWNTSMDFSDGKITYDADTRLFSSWQEPNWVNRPDCIYLSNDLWLFDYTCLTNEAGDGPAENLNDFEKKCYDYITMTGDNGDELYEVNLGEIGGYYPLSVQLNPLQENGGISYSTFGSSALYYDADTEFLKGFKEYFRIPFAGNHKAVIHVVKSNGQLDMMDMYNSEIEGDDSYNMWTMSAQNEDAMFFSISNRTAQGEIIDTSLIPGGYGIYMLPYEIVTKQFSNGKTAPDVEYRVDEMKTICPLDEKAEVRYIEMFGDKSVLCVCYLIDDEAYIREVDAKTGEILKETALSTLGFECSKGNWSTKAVDDSGILIVYSEDSAVLFSSDEKGHLIHEFTAEIQKTDKLNLIEIATDIAYDGERLVIVAPPRLDLEYYSYLRPMNSFCLGIITENGLEYLGCFNNSLDGANRNSTNGVPDFNEFYHTWNSNDSIGSWDDDGIKISFQS